MDIFLTFQAHNRSIDLGVLQMTLTYSRYQLVDFAPPISIYEFCYSSLLPKEVGSFETLFIPFDFPTWGFFIVSMSMVGGFLIWVDYIWMKGKEIKEIAYEGELRAHADSCHLSHLIIQYKLPVLIITCMIY